MHRPLAWLALTGLSIAAWTALRNQRRQQLAAQPQAQAQPVQTWEGEGGGLPDGGPGQTVSPTPPAGDVAVYADAAERESSA